MVYLLSLVYPETGSARLEFMQKNSPIGTDCCPGVPLVKLLRFLLNLPWELGLLCQAGHLGPLWDPFQTVL